MDEFERWHRQVYPRVYASVLVVCGGIQVKPPAPVDTMIETLHVRRVS